MHPDIAASYNNLGMAYYGLGENRAAIGYHEKALTLELRRYPDGMHPSILRSYRNLSKAWREAGDAPRSVQYAKKADEIEAKLKR